MVAWIVLHKGFGVVAVCAARSKGMAKQVMYESARDAGYPVQWTEFLGRRAPVVDAPARDNRAWVAQRQWDLTMNIVCHLAQSTDERQHAELLAATLAALEAGGVVL